MSDKPEQTSPEQAEQFAQQASEGRTGLISEFVSFLLHNKKWWLVPIIVVLLLIGALLVIGGTGAAPFIYTLF